MKKLILKCLLFSSLSATSQNKLQFHQETEIGLLKIKFPGEVTLLDTAAMSVYSTIKDSAVFQVMWATKPTRAKSASHLSDLYEHFVRGYLNSPNTRNHKNIVTDTSIGGTTGKFIVSRSTENSCAYRNIYCYTTLANDHFYIINIFANSWIANEEDFKAYFSSIKFSSSNIKENDLVLYSKGFEFGQILGSIILYASVLAVIGLVFYRRITNRKKRLKKD